MIQEYDDVECCLDFKNAIKMITDTRSQPLSTCLKDVYGPTNSEYLSLKKGLDDDIERLKKSRLAQQNHQKIEQIINAEMLLIKGIEQRNSVEALETALSWRDSLIIKAPLLIKNIHQKIIAMAYSGEKNNGARCGEWHERVAHTHVCPWQKNSTLFLARTKNILRHYRLFIRDSIEPVALSQKLFTPLCSPFKKAHIFFVKGTH